MRIYLIILLLFYTAGITKSDPCITREGQKGYCVFIDACPEILQIVRNNTEFVRSQYLCEANLDYVCCKNPTTYATYGKELSDRAYCGLQHSDDYYASDRTDTLLDEFPWVAAFVGTNRKTGKTSIVCHGTLINSRYILTDGICFSGIAASYINITKVLLGEHHANTTIDCIDLQQFNETECTKAEEFGIEETIFHPYFKASSEINTIALIRLNKQVTYSDYIRPICLPVQGTKFARPGDTLYTTGWGTIKSFSTISAEVKKRIQTILQTPEECEQKYKRNISALHYICTLDSNENTAYSCKSDIGAPVMFSHRNQWHIEGIVSKGGICGSQYPGIHIRVTSYLEWIKQSIRP